MGQGGRKPGAGEAAARRKLLGRVAVLYHQAFLEDPRAKGVLEALGLKDLSMLTEFKVGYVNGSLMATIPEDGELQEGLKALGVLDGEGREALAGCVVVPWFGEGGPEEGAACLGLAGIRETGEEVYLPSPVEGVWNHSAAKRSKRFIMTDSILTALRLVQAGLVDVIPLLGKDGLTQDHLGLFARYGVKEVALAFEASEAVLAALGEEGVTARVVSLSTLLDTGEVERTATGFNAAWENRCYRVNGIEKGAVKLKASVRVFVKGKESRFHLDAVDLVSHRGRKTFAKDTCSVVGLSEESVFEDLGKLLGVAEEYTATPQAAVRAPMTEQEKAEALALLQDPGLLKRIQEDFTVCGYEGEEGNKLTGYLATISRKLEEPLAVLIQSRSAAGKSALQDALLQFVPPEDLEKYTRLTGQALFYKDENGLCHKLLAVEEEAGARDASYSIRNLQSSKFLSIATTGKDAATGKLRTTEYRVKGPVALMLTTTSVDMDYETQNRFITLTIDESKVMTERILTRQREGETLEGLKRKAQVERIRKMHQNAQRLLKPVAVVNPYAPKLTFPAQSLRARRDHKKYLGLIKAVAFLYQHQRELKTYEVEGQEPISYVEVIPEDIEQANRLAAQVLGRTVDELSAPGRALLGEIQRMVKVKTGGEWHFTRKDIRAFTGWGDFQLKTHLGELEELEYLWAVTGRKGKEYVYELAEGLGATPDGGIPSGEPKLSGLVSPERPEGIERVGV